MATTTVSQFHELLEQRQISLNNARSLAASLQSRMTATERAETIRLLAMLEAHTEIERSKPQLLALTKEGWLHDYLLFAQASESPDSFHFYSAVAVLSHLIGRNAYFNLGVSRIHAPLSVFLVSPAGQTRRSTAIRTAVRIGQNAGASIVQDTASPEGLVDHLTLSPTSLIVADEAATILNRQEYMSSMPQLLCTVLDCPPRYERKLRGRLISVERPTVNALIGCAPDWITTAMPKNAVGGGLFSRMLIVYESHRKRLIPLPDPNEVPILAEMESRLTAKLAELATVQPGEMCMTDPARALYQEFYADNDLAMSAASDRIAIYLSRKPDYVLKMCMSLLVSRGATDRLELDVNTLEDALAILRLLEEGIATAYRVAGMERIGRHLDRVRRVIAKTGEVDRSTLLRSVSDVMDARELDQILRTLGESGQIIWPPERRPTGGKLLTIYSIGRN